MNNIELVDLKPSARRQEEPSSTEEEEGTHEREMMMVNSRRWLKGKGWGSPHATTLILNNLLFITAKVNAHMLHVRLCTDCGTSMNYYKEYTFLLKT